MQTQTDLAYWYKLLVLCYSIIVILERIDWYKAGYNVSVPGHLFHCGMLVLFVGVANVGAELRGGTGDHPPAHRPAGRPNPISVVLLIATSAPARC